MSRLWILGASDPEMEAIERLLREAGEAVAYATVAGERVRPESAYRAHIPVCTCGTVASGDPVAPVSDDVCERCGTAAPDEAYLVECDGPTGLSRKVTIDHHKPGDPGYGRPPAEFLPASSIGQVIAELARLGTLPDWQRDQRHNNSVSAIIPHEYILCAAADHCLSAAYRGECPGVSPDALMRWRIETRAAFQRRPADEILADVERAREILRLRAVIALADGIYARDLRGQHVPELPEVSAREGICFVADGLPGPDGRTKVVCQSGAPAQIEAFMEDWAPAEGLTDIYGDPARGFAGGYRDLCHGGCDGE